MPIPKGCRWSKAKHKRCVEKVRARDGKPRGHVNKPLTVSLYRTHRERQRCSTKYLKV